MKADLLEMVKGYPCHMEEMVAHTPDDHLFLNRIGDRYMAVAPVTSCCAGCFRIPERQPQSRNCRVTVHEPCVHQPAALLNPPMLCCRQGG